MAHQQSTDHELNARLLRYRSKPESQDPLALAEALLSAQRYGDARGVAVSAQPDDPGDARLLLLEGQAWLLEGHLDRALDKFAAAAALQPEEAAHYQWLGRALQLRGDPLRAVHALSRAMELKPESEETRQALTAAQEALAEAEARAKQPPVEAKTEVAAAEASPELPTTAPDLEAEPVLEAKPETEVEPELPNEVEVEFDAESESEAEPELAAAAELQAEAESDEEAEPETEPEAPAAAELQAETELDEVPELEMEPEAQVGAEPEEEALAAAALTEGEALEGESDEAVQAGEALNASEETPNAVPSEPEALAADAEASAESAPQEDAGFDASDADETVSTSAQQQEPLSAETRPTVDQTQSFETSSDEDELAQAEPIAVATAEESKGADFDAAPPSALDDEEMISETSPGLGPMTLAEEDALWAPTSTTSAFGDIDSPQASVSAAGDLDAPTMRSSAGDLDSPLGDWFSSEEDDALLTEESEDEAVELHAEMDGLSDLVPSVVGEEAQPEPVTFEAKEDPFTAALHALHSSHPSLPLVFDSAEEAHAAPASELEEEEHDEAVAATDEPVLPLDEPVLPLERSPEGVFGRQADDVLNLPVAWDGPVVGAFSDSNAPVAAADLVELSEMLEPEAAQADADDGADAMTLSEAQDSDDTSLHAEADSDEALFDDEHGELARTFFETEPPPAYEGDDEDAVEAVEAVEPVATPAEERPMLSLRPVEVTRRQPARKGRALPVVASIALVAACAAGGYVVTRANMESKGADEVLAELAKRAPSDLGVHWASMQETAQAASARVVSELDAARVGLSAMFAPEAEAAQPTPAAAQPATEAVASQTEPAEVVSEAETLPATEAPLAAESVDQAKAASKETAKVDETPVQAEVARPAAPSVRATAGLARLSEGDVEGARAVLAQLSTAARTQESGLLLRAELEILDGRPQRALHQLRHLRGAEQRSVALLNTLGHALYALDEVDRAAGAFELALEQKPNDLIAMVGRAEVHLRAERSADAIALLERARAARSQASEAQKAQLLTLLGHAYLQREADGDRELAYGVLRSAIALPSAPAEAYFWLGESLAGRRTSEATRAYTTYLERAPRGRYVDRARRALGPLL